MKRLSNKLKHQKKYRKKILKLKSNNKKNCKTVLTILILNPRKYLKNNLRLTASAANLTTAHKINTYCLYSCTRVYFFNQFDDIKLREAGKSNNMLSKKKRGLNALLVRHTTVPPT